MEEIITSEEFAAKQLFWVASQFLHRVRPWRADLHDRPTENR